MKNRTIRTSNKFVEYDSAYGIYLYNIKSEKIATALIDKEDIKKVIDYKWYLCQGYVTTHLKNSTKKLRIHTLFLPKKDGFDVDHINQNPLDNRKQNLRYATRSQNNINSKRKGIYWYERKKRWIAQIGVNKKTIHLGSFKNEKDALRVRREAELKYY